MKERIRLYRYLVILGRRYKACTYLHNHSRIKDSYFGKLLEIEENIRCICNILGQERVIAFEEAKEHTFKKLNIKNYLR